MEVQEQHNIEQLLETVCDPEIPVLSIIDLGILRSVEFDDTIGDGEWVITITPTYSGCPAMDMINSQIRFTLLSHGISNFRIKQVLSPAWTTEWMTAHAKEKLRAYGVAAPNNIPAKYRTDEIADAGPAACPQCGSTEITLISSFGSTACKSLYRCDQCLEPFDYFKCH